MTTPLPTRPTPPGSLPPTSQSPTSLPAGSLPPPPLTPAPLPAGSPAPTAPSPTSQSAGSPAPRSLSHRALAMLRAVQAGRAELTDSCEPDLRVDGLACCDQAMAHSLAHAGLVAVARSGPTGAWLPAILTPSGEQALAAA